MICRGCRLQICQKTRHKRSRQNQWDWPCNDCLPESDLERSFQYCWWSPKVADGASWWLTASTPSHWWHCSFHILHPITLFPVDAEMCYVLFSNFTLQSHGVVVHILDRVAGVAREHGWHPPKSLDSDEYLKPEHTLFCRELRFVAIYALFFGDLWA